MPIASSFKMTQIYAMNYKSPGPSTQEWTVYDNENQWQIEFWLLDKLKLYKKMFDVCSIWLLILLT